MTPDRMMSIPFSVACALSAINLYALFRDGDARGVRPYLASWLFFGNSFAAYQMSLTSLPISASFVLLNGLINAAQAIMIIRYQWNKAP